MEPHRAGNPATPRRDCCVMAQYVFQYKTRLTGRSSCAILHARNVGVALCRVLRDRRAHSQCDVVIVRMKRPEHGGNKYFTGFPAGEYYRAPNRKTLELMEEEEGFDGVS